MTQHKHTLYGEGGGGSAQQPTIHPDGLHSQSLMEAVVAVSEGPIAGPLQDSFQHIFVDNTPVLSSGGQPNFETGSLRLGYNKGDELTPTPIPYYLKGSGIAYGVTADLKQGEPVIRTTPAVRRGLFNQLEVLINVQRLLRSNSDGQFRTSVTFAIEYCVSGTSAWQSFTGSPFTVNQKTTTGARLEYKMRVGTTPADQDYDIRVSRFSPDTDTEYLADLQWEAFEVVLTHDQSPNHRSHADLALLHVLAYSNHQFSSLPSVTGIYGGLLVSVPTNYDPLTRTYNEAEPWDGTFTSTKYWTDNPFWLIRELVMNERFGMRRYQPMVTLNDYDLYQLAKDADQMVGFPVGPKYTFNGVLADPKPGMETLRYIAGTAFANIYDDGRGNLTVVGERASAPSMLLIPEAVSAPEQGDNVTFNYSFTDLKERYNLVHASFVNPNRGWDLEPLPPLTLSNLPESQDPTVQRFGAQPLELELPGCIYEHEAHRKAVRILVEANTETVLLSCTLPMAGQLLQLGDVVEVGDAEMGWGLTGRLRAVAGNQVTLHTPVNFTQTGTYTLKLQGYLGIETLTFAVTEPGELSVLTCNQAPEDIPPFAGFIMEHTEFLGQSQTFRVMALDEVQGVPGQYQVQLKLLNLDKFDAEEQAYFAGLPEREAVNHTLDPATDVQAAFIRELLDGEPILRLHAQWQASSQALRYEVWGGSDTGTGFQLLGETPINELFLDVPPNNYQIFVRAVGLFGTRDSPPVAVTLIKITAAHLAANASQVTVTPLTVGFQRRDLHFNVKLTLTETFQDQELALDLFNLSTLKRIFIQVRDRVSGELLREMDLPRTGVVYTYEQQLFDLNPPSGKLDVDLYLDDYLGDRFGPLQFQYSASLYPELIGLTDDSRYWGLRVTPQYNFDIYPKPQVQWYLGTQNNFANAEPVDVSPTLQYLSVAGGQTFFVWGAPDLPFGPGAVFPSETTGFQVTIPLAVEPPETPTGVVVQPGSTWAFLSWDTHNNYGTGHTRIYRQETLLTAEGQPVDPPQLDMGDMWVGASPGLNYADRGLRSGRGYYYWLSHVNGLGEEGPLHAVNGTYVVTVRNASEILEEIAGDISWDDFSPTTQATLTTATEDQALAGIVNLVENARGQTRQRVNERLGLEKALAEVQQEAEDRIAAIQAEAAARAAAIQAEQGARAAAIQDEQTARTDADTALANSVTTLTSAVNQNIADILAEQTARADADTALANSVSALTATVTNNQTSTDAAILDEQTARADADTALADSVSALTATVTDNQTTTDAAILAEQTARADADTALAQSVQTVQSSVDDTDASVQTLSQAVATLDSEGSAAHKALWSVQAQAGDVTAGIGIVADGQGGSEVVIAAGKVSVFDPAQPTTKDNLFVVEGGNVYMNTAYLKQAFIDTLIANGITAERVNALDLNAVNITGGQIQIGNNFSVDGAGNMIANDATLTGNLVVPNAFIDTAHLKVGAIKYAQIGDAEVGTLKIAGNAVTIPLSVYISGAINSSSNWVTLAAGTIGEGNANLYVAGSCDVDLTQVGSSLVYATLGIFVDGVERVSRNFWADGAAFSEFSLTVGGGSHSVELRAKDGGDGYAQFSKRSLFAILTKR